ncbi:galactan beta-1,4-galactosyltransferase GALS3 [Nicotiana tomentosiformis]|uniref:galactan beta-1,4-galactosyltransferase GALS3 n=1 Tax=Nicotiana tomentosiformis TaxID=4098 RepID=UPI00051C387B|nr:galactan beta-1,4-galactosyltransferase GALS3 [Nicotiana tomentosiformis]XP_033512825.1 galactan beta-1,4-galactosyltransferase GALS3 [Nicotiana tomentosiformis]
MTKEKERKMFVGVVWNCAAELKLLLTAILFLCSLVTILQFMPSRFSFTPSNFSTCLSTPISPSTSFIDSISAINATSIPPPPPLTKNDEILENGVIKRAFNPSGSAAYNFILMSAYRGGLNTFAVMGLASKPLHVYGKPSYQCEWIPNDDKLKSITVNGSKILPDWGYGRVYTVLVINCTFPIPVGTENGGKLVIHAATNGGGDAKFNTVDTFVGLTETEQDFINFTAEFNKPPKYDFFYCGSSLYGNLSPQRVREWLAFHVRLFGEKSHFVIHDAGGIHEGVMAVLKPWMEKGFVTLQDIRDQERFDGYYHNQFLIVNDCLHRYRFQAKWMFFFDVDEFIFVPKKSTIKTVVDSLSDFTQFTIEQMPMSNKLCLEEDRGKSYRKWGFEKLVYKDIKRGIRRDRKYAVQPRNVIATGVHMSQNIVGKTTHKTEGLIKYFHYHGTIAERREPCRQLVNATAITVDRTPYAVDTTMRDIAGIVKRFELKMIGPVLQRTRQ